MEQPTCPNGSKRNCLNKEDLNKLSLSKVPIPVNEALRVFTLKATEVLDSDTSEPSFDRFVALAQRIFDVPIALISLVDVDRQWFKANVGLEHVSQTHRDLAFCAYTILPESPDVLVIEDTLLDYRFRDNQLVLGEPHIRFYAGAAIIVDDNKIGSLCIIDRVPRIGFTEKDRMNLLDLGAAVSILFSERKNAQLKSNSDRARMMNEMMHRIHPPLISITSRAESITIDSKNREKRLANRETTCDEKEKGDKQNEELEFENESETPQKMADLQVTVGVLKVIVESVICLSDFVMETAASEETKWGSFTATNIFTVIDAAKLTLENLLPLIKLTWETDYSQLCKGTRHVCSPNAIAFTLLNTVEQLSSLWKTIGVKIYFEDTGDIEYDCIVQQLDDAPLSDIESTWQQGLLIIDFVLSDKYEGLETSPWNSEVRPTPQGYMSLYSLQQVLKDVEGQCTHLDTGSSYDQIMTVSMPCAIIIASKEYESGYISPPTTSSGESRGDLFLDIADLGRAGDSRHDSSVAMKSATYSTLSDLTECNTKKLLKVTINASSNSTVDQWDTQCGPPKYPPPPAAIAASCAAQMSREKQPAPHNTPVGNVESKIRKLSVLLVEDTISQQKLMSKWLHGQGCEVVCAVNGKIGLELLKTKQFDVAFIDFLMPVMSGPETIQELHKWCSTTSPPEYGFCDTTNYDLWVNKNTMIVGISASAGDDELAKAFVHGMHFFCPKPVETAMLASILKMLRQATSLQSALDEIGENAISMENKRILTARRLSLSKAQIAPEGSKNECTGESSEIVVSRGRPGWQIFKKISRLLSGDRAPSPTGMKTKMIAVEANNYSA